LTTENIHIQEKAGLADKTEGFIPGVPPKSFPVLTKSSE